MRTDPEGAPRARIDWTRVVVTAEVVVGAVLVAGRVARRPAAAVAQVTMGPGGWVSMRGGALTVRPARRAWRRVPGRGPAAATAGRPWWAWLLAARPLPSVLER